MSSHQWFYIKTGMVSDETIGPLSEADFVQLVREGNVKRDAAVASPTRTNNQWISLSDVPGLVTIWDEGQAARDAQRQAEKQQRAVEKAQRQADQQQQRETRNTATRQQREQLAEISDCTDHGLVEKLAAEVSTLLTSGESIEYIAVQKKPVNVKPDAIVATNRRLIFFRPKLLGRFDFWDFLWRDLGDAHLVQGMLGSTFSARHTGGRVLSMDYLPKDAAQRLYRIAQEREEAAIEERRRREMEERRAGAAQVQVNAPAAPTAAARPQPSSGTSLSERLATLKSLFDQDLITREEFDKKKAEIIADV
jgi:hypothetical protein